MTVVALHGVFAHDEAGPKRTPRGALGGVSFELDVGVTAVLATPEDGALALFELLSGARRPRRGVVRIAGEDPSRSSGTRARIGALGLEATLPEARSVADAVSIAAAAWTRSVTTSDVLGPYGLAKLASRPLASLSVPEARSVERALALSVPEPALVVLHEPFFDDGAASEVASRIESLGARATVVVLTSSLRDARVAREALVLARGAVVHRGPASEIGPDGAVELVIEVARGARALAACLAEAPAAGSVSLTTWGDAAEAPGSVRVSGADVRAVARAVADATRATGADVRSLGESVAQLSDVRTLNEWRGRIADAAARQAAALRAQMGTWRPVGRIPYGPAPAPPEAPAPEAPAPDAPAPEAPAPEAPAPEAPAPEAPATEANPPDEPNSEPPR